MEIKVKLPKGEASTSFSGLSTEEDTEQIPKGGEEWEAFKRGRSQWEAVGIGEDWGILMTARGWVFVLFWLVPDWKQGQIEKLSIIDHVLAIRGQL